jgi:hypothetical protein
MFTVAVTAGEAGEGGGTVSRKVDINRTMERYLISSPGGAGVAAHLWLFKFSVSTSLLFLRSCTLGLLPRPPPHSRYQLARFVTVTSSHSSTPIRGRSSWSGEPRQFRRGRQVLRGRHVCRSSPPREQQHRKLPIKDDIEKRHKEPGRS